MPEQTSEMVLCHDCDLLQRRIALANGSIACCVRCQAPLYRSYHAHHQMTQFALLIAGLVLFVIANAFPMVSLQVEGHRVATTLSGTVLALWRQSMEPVAVLVGLTAIVVPAIQLVSLAWLLLPLWFNRSPAGFAGLMRLLYLVRPWGMAEVFLMGVLVALVKLSHLASIDLRAGFWSFAALIVVRAVNASFFDAQELWTRYQNLPSR